MKMRDRCVMCYTFIVVDMHCEKSCVIYGDKKLVWLKCVNSSRKLHSDIGRMECHLLYVEVMCQLKLEGKLGLGLC